jgi:hypothetical protein
MTPIREEHSSGSHQPHPPAKAPLTFLDLTSSAFFAVFTVCGVIPSSSNRASSSFASRGPSFKSSAMKMSAPWWRAEVTKPARRLWPEKTAASQPAASARFLMIAATERSVSLSGVTEPRFLSLWFTEGLDTVDLRDARDLLNELGAMRELGISGSRAAE